MNRSKRTFIALLLLWSFVVFSLGSLPHSALVFCIEASGQIKVEYAKNGECVSFPAENNHDQTATVVGQEDDHCPDHMADIVFETPAQQVKKPTISFDRVDLNVDVNHDNRLSIVNKNVYQRLQHANNDRNVSPPSSISSTVLLL